jgi:hypothetical protein
MEMPPTKINCLDKDWKAVLKLNLQEQRDVDLTDFDYTVDGQFCELLALAHSARFQLDARNKAGAFKKQTAA